MSTAKEVAEVKSQLEDGIARLRESFGMLEHDMEQLTGAPELVHHAALESYQADDNAIRNEAAAAALDAVNAALEGVKGASGRFGRAFEDLAGRYQEEATHVESEMQEHRVVCEQLVASMNAFADTLGHSVEEIDGVRAEHAAQVQELVQRLDDLGERVFAAAGETDSSLRQAQAETFEKALDSISELVDHHMEQTLPALFEESQSQLGETVQQLGEHVSAAADTLQNELQTLLDEVSDFTAQQIHDRIEEKMKGLIEEVVGYLASRIAESVSMTTTGAAITAALAELIPVLIALKAATGALKEAIHVWKELQEMMI